MTRCVGAMMALTLLAAPVLAETPQRQTGPQTTAPQTHPPVSEAPQAKTTTSEKPGQAVAVPSTVLNPQVLAAIPTLQTRLDDLEGKLKKTEADLKAANDRITLLDSKLADLQASFDAHSHRITMSDNDLGWTTPEDIKVKTNYGITTIMTHQGVAQFLKTTGPCYTC